MRESKTTLLMASANLNVQSGEFNDKCPHPEARPSLHLAGNRELNGDGVEHDMGCSVLGRGAEPPQFWVLLIWLETGISHVTWVHYDATMCLACFVCSILPVLHFL